MKRILGLMCLLLCGCSQGTHSTVDTLAPGSLLKDCDICPEMVVLPQGSFIMGTPADEVARQPDEGPQHEVIFSRPFAIGIYPVTAGEWEAYRQEAGVSGRSGDTRPGRACTQGKPSYPQDPRQPAVCMTYHDVQDYVRWLAAKTGKPYRMVSEAEWEYAARAGSTGAFPFPFDQEGVYTINKHANTYSDADGFAYTSVAGSFPPNAFGVFDMHGNVYEWVADCWHGDYVGAPVDGSAWTEFMCSSHQIRGNDWIEPPMFSRSGNRNDRAPEVFGDWLGFRVALD